MAYGQTGSGKTHTMGLSEGCSEAGLVGRTVEILFDAIQRTGLDVVTKVSFHGSNQSQQRWQVEPNRDQARERVSHLFRQESIY